MAVESELNPYLQKVLLKDTFLKAKEREAFGQLRKLFVLACNDLSPLRRRAAGMLLFPPRLYEPEVYWSSAPGELKEVFQTEQYPLRVGLLLTIPNPDLTQQKRRVLEVEANGIRLTFIRKFNSSGEHDYQVKAKMNKDSPLAGKGDAMNWADFTAQRLEGISQNSTEVLKLLELTARFTLEVLRTKGLMKGEAHLF